MTPRQEPESHPYPPEPEKGEAPHKYVSATPAWAGGPCVYCLRKEGHHMHDVPIGPFRFVGWHAQFEWKLQDLWVGAFWKRTGNCVDLWLCLLPCVPLHVSWWWSREPI